MADRDPLANLFAGPEQGDRPMNTEQTPGAPTGQEWAEVEALILGTVVQWAGDAANLDDCREVTAALLPALSGLIDREREAARAEGMAAVAGPVLALADEWERDAADVAVLLDHDADELRESLLRESGALRAAAFILRAAIPADATEALARLKAQWQAEALREVRRLAVRCYPRGMVPTGQVIADLEERIDRTAQQDGATDD